MAAQDGLDYLVEAVHHIVNTLGRRDVTFALIGSGDRLDSLKAMARDRAVDDYIEFRGRINDDTLLTSYLSTADVCVAPDPKNEMNDKCSLIKIVEYMAMGRPVVGFDLAESQITAGEAAVYATRNDTSEFGDRIVELLDDPERRRVMGAAGKKRVEEALSWSHSKRHLLAAYDAALVGKLAKKEETQVQDVA
jgi:glycosyltransferase involved in cell wall biosynthesis